MERLSRLALVYWCTLEGTRRLWWRPWDVELVAWSLGLDIWGPTGTKAEHVRRTVHT